MYRLLLLITIITCSCFVSEGQHSSFIAAKMQNDTIVVDTLEPVYVVRNKGIFERYRQWRYNRNVRNFIKVYPYAKRAGVILSDINKEYLAIKTEKERKKFIKVAEKKLFAEFEQDLKNMTISQGRMLIKLVDRETGNTTYEIVKEFKGGFSAFFWQSLAVLFGSSLKYEYDKDGKDANIERLVDLYEKGLLHDTKKRLSNKQ